MKEVPLIDTRTRANSVPRPRPRPLAATTWEESDGLLILDARGGVLFCSNAGAAILGRQAPQITGRPITSVLPDLPLHANMPAFNLALIADPRANSPWTRRSHRTVDGRDVILEASVGDGEEVGRRQIVFILKRPPPPH